jgi:hypothetical protein
VIGGDVDQAPAQARTARPEEGCCRKVRNRCRVNFTNQFFQHAVLIVCDERKLLTW